MTLLPAQGAAQVPPQKVAADAAFDEGKRLMGDGKHEAACAKFAESQRLDPASSTLVWLGECLEKTGKLASAWSTFREAASMAARQGKSDREKLARDRVAALDPRVPRVVLAVREAPAGLGVAMDGVEIGQALWGTPLPVDPGAHQLRLRAPGFQEQTVPFEAREGGGTQEVLLPRLARVAAPPASSGAPVASSSAPPPPGPSEAPPASVNAGAPGLSGRQITGLILGGAGLVLGGVGGLLQVDARSKADDARSKRDRALYDDASSQQTLAVSGMLLGGALLTGGVVLFLMPPSPASTGSLRLAPSVSSKGSSLWLSGSFLPCVASLSSLSSCSSPRAVSAIFPRMTSAPSRAPARVPVAPVPPDHPELPDRAVTPEIRGDPLAPGKAAPGGQGKGGAVEPQGRGEAELPARAAEGASPRGRADHLELPDRGAQETGAPPGAPGAEPLATAARAGMAGSLATAAQAAMPVRAVPRARAARAGWAAPRASVVSLELRAVAREEYPEVPDKAVPVEGRAAEGRGARQAARRAQAARRTAALG